MLERGAREVRREPLRAVQLRHLCGQATLPVRRQQRRRARGDQVPRRLGAAHTVQRRPPTWKLRRCVVLALHASVGTGLTQCREQRHIVLQRGEVQRGQAVLGRCIEAGRLGRQAALEHCERNAAKLPVSSAEDQRRLVVWPLHEPGHLGHGRLAMCDRLQQRPKRSQRCFNPIARPAGGAGVVHQGAVHACYRATAVVRAEQDRSAVRTGEEAVARRHVAELTTPGSSTLDSAHLGWPHA